eukprot:gene2002-5082_t
MGFPSAGAAPGALAGNAALVAAVSLVALCGVAAARRCCGRGKAGLSADAAPRWLGRRGRAVLGLTQGNVVDSAALLKFPSVALLAFHATYQGSAFCAMRLVAAPPRRWMAAVGA